MLQGRDLSRYHPYYEQCIRSSLDHYNGMIPMGISRTPVQLSTDPHLGSFQLLNPSLEMGHLCTSTFIIFTV